MRPYFYERVDCATFLPMKGRPQPFWRDFGKNRIVLPSAPVVPARFLAPPESWTFSSALGPIRRTSFS